MMGVGRNGCGIWTGFHESSLTRVAQPKGDLVRGPGLCQGGDAYSYLLGRRYGTKNIPATVGRPGTQVTAVPTRTHLGKHGGVLRLEATTSILLLEVRTYYSVGTYE